MGLLRRKPALLNGPAFLLRLSILLKEGYTFNDGLNLLLPHHMKEYKSVLTEIDEDFREGHDVTHILRHLGFTSSTLLPVAIAEKNGRLDEALHGMANRLKKTEEMTKKLKSLLAYPTVLFIFITVLLFGFRRFFLPNMEALTMTRQEDEVGIISKIPTLVAKVPDLIIGTGMALIVVLVISTFLYMKFTPANKIRFFAAIPIAKNLFFMWKTRIFASEIGSLLQSGLSLQESLDILSRQNLDPVLSEIAKNIHEQVIYGEPLHAAVEMTNGLTEEFSSFARHGADSGHLPKELLIYGDHLDDEINRKLMVGLAILQPALFSLIAICILAAYIALLLPIYGMLDEI